MENNGLKLQNRLELLAFIQVVDVTINMTEDLILPLVSSQLEAIVLTVCIQRFAFVTNMAFLKNTFLD